MAYILHIESSSTVCSVALSHQQHLLAIKELDAGYTHAENLHVFIQHVLQEQHLSMSVLQAIAVSSGPGSYTGLRIGFATAKALAYALHIPLIVVDTLRVLSSLAKIQVPGAGAYCPMLDARRMEVYTALYSPELGELRAPEALVLDDAFVKRFASEGRSVCFFGDGMPKAKDMLQALPGACFAHDIKPGSEAMIALAYQKYQAQDFADTAYATPFYLKDFYFAPTKK